MYTEYFGLIEMPFRTTPDPRLLWYSPQHREVKAKILHHIQSRKGPVYLFADVGTGKTNIAKRIHDELAEDKSKRVVFAFAPNLKTSNAFLRFVMDEFGVKTDRSYATSLKHFQHFLVDQYKAGVSPEGAATTAGTSSISSLNVRQVLASLKLSFRFIGKARIQIMFPVN